MSISTGSSIDQGRPNLNSWHGLVDFGAFLTFNCGQMQGIEWVGEPISA